jgi:hypothetical protein
MDFSPYPAGLDSATVVTLIFAQALSSVCPYVSHPHPLPAFSFLIIHNAHSYLNILCRSSVLWAIVALAKKPASFRPEDWAPTVVSIVIYR